jgi:hypothetical protein
MLKERKRMGELMECGITGMGKVECGMRKERMGRGNYLNAEGGNNKGGAGHKAQGARIENSAF